MTNANEEIQHHDNEVMYLENLCKHSENVTNLKLQDFLQKTSELNESLKKGSVNFRDCDDKFDEIPECGELCLKCRFYFTSLSFIERIKHELIGSMMHGSCSSTIEKKDTMCHILNVVDYFLVRKKHSEIDVTKVSRTSRCILYLKDELFDHMLLNALLPQCKKLNSNKRHLWYVTMRHYFDLFQKEMKRLVWKEDQLKEKEPFHINISAKHVNLLSPTLMAVPICRSLTDHFGESKIIMSENNEQVVENITTLLNNFTNLQSLTITTDLKHNVNPNNDDVICNIGHRKMNITLFKNILSRLSMHCKMKLQCIEIRGDHALEMWDYINNSSFNDIEMAEFPSLREISFSDTDLDELPKPHQNRPLNSFSINNGFLEGCITFEDPAWRSLMNLDLQHNEIKSISMHNMVLRNIQILCLGDNNVSSIPSLDQFPMLRELELQKNNLSNLNFSNMERPHENLEVLILANNEIESIPTELNQKFPRLKSLDVSCNYISEFPTCFNVVHSGVFKHLVKVDISENFIWYLPLDLRSLKNVHTLNLSSNMISMVPDHVVGIHPNVIFL
jgi:Leucine-rich repeat (LRR) protein